MPIILFCLLIKDSLWPVSDTHLRLGMGLVGNMDIIDNMMLRSYKGGHTAFLERKAPKDLANAIIKDLEVVTPSAETPVRRLSGGNEV